MNVDPALTGVLRSLLSLQTLGCIFQTGSGSRRRLWRCGMEQDNSCLSHCSMASNTESNLSPGDSRVLLHALDKVGTATASSSPALNSGTGLFHVSHCKLQFGEQDLRISCTSQGLQSPARLCPAQRIPGGFGLEKSIQCHALPRAGTILLSQVSPSPSRPWIDPFKLPSSPPASHHTHGIQLIFYFV